MIPDDETSTALAGFGRLLGLATLLLAGMVAVCWWAVR